MFSSNQSRTLTKSGSHWICASCWAETQPARRSFSLLISGRKVKLNGRGHYIQETRRKYATDGQSPATNKLEQSKPLRKPRSGGNLPTSPARTRFAPSPTGYMHIGGLRTALFSYLLAKRTGGQFILRIEDTDQKRFVADAEQRLCEDLQWAGIQWDEGPQIGGDYGPYKQSERNHIYQKYAKELIDSGGAYRCFCEKKLSGDDQAAWLTSGCHSDCSSISAAESEERSAKSTDSNPFVVRLRMTHDNKKGYPDLIYGKIQRLKRGEDSSDPVLIKGDGIPTYHFANVVDDHLMEITHVIRGSEWMASLPLHYDLYTAFGWKPPLFAHVGLLVDKDGAKLSKRNNSSFHLDIKSLKKEQAVLPEALCNFLTLLGWSNPQKEDVMSMQELIQNFDLKFTRGNSIVTADKLWYLQKGHVHRRSVEAQSTNSLEPLRPLINAIETELSSLYNRSDVHTRRDLPLDVYISEILQLDSKEYLTATQYVSRNRYFFHFDPSQVPDTEIPLPKANLIHAVESPEKFLKDLLLNFDFLQPYTSTPFAPKTPSSYEAGDFRSAAKRITAAISCATWRAMVPPTQLTPAIESEVLGFCSLEQDVNPMKKTATYIAETFYADTEDVTAEEVLAQYKAWQNVLWKILRQKLCYGMPGPGTGSVMAVLGWEDCCRRLGCDVSDAKGNGW